MNIIELAFTSYSVTDVKKARAFYENVLGLKAASVYEDAEKGMAFIEYNIGPATFSIGAGASDFKPGPGGGTVAFEVADFEQSVAELRKASIPFVIEPMDTGVCHMALVTDPDGNRVMIHTRKPI